MSIQHLPSSSLRGIALLCLLLVAMPACDRDETDEESASAASPEESSHRTGNQGSSPEDEHPEGEEGHDHHGDEHDHAIRIGRKMQDVGHRFAAVWYAGRHGRLEMLDYQLHELQETGGEITEANVTEHGVDVSSRFEADILSQLDKLEEPAESGDVETFEKRYNSMRKRCNACHAATEHDFIDVTEPTRNPYPNLELSGQ